MKSVSKSCYPKCDQAGIPKVNFGVNFQQTPLPDAQPICSRIKLLSRTRRSRYDVCLGQTRSTHLTSKVIFEKLFSPWVENNNRLSRKNLIRICFSSLSVLQTHNNKLGYQCYTYKNVRSIIEEETPSMMPQKMLIIQSKDTPLPLPPTPPTKTTNLPTPSILIFSQLVLLNLSSPSAALALSS